MSPCDLIRALQEAAKCGEIGWHNGLTRPLWDGFFVFDAIRLNGGNSSMVNISNRLWFFCIHQTSSRAHVVR